MAPLPATAMMPDGVKKAGESERRATSRGREREGRGTTAGFLNEGRNDVIRSSVSVVTVQQMDEWPDGSDPFSRGDYASLKRHRPLSFGLTGSDVSIRVHAGNRNPESGSVDSGFISPFVGCREGSIPR